MFPRPQVAAPPLAGTFIFYIPFSELYLFNLKQLMMPSFIDPEAHRRYEEENALTSFFSRLLIFFTETTADTCEHFLSQKLFSESTCTAHLILTGFSHEKQLLLLSSEVRSLSKNTLQKLRQDLLSAL